MKKSPLLVASLLLSAVVAQDNKQPFAPDSMAARTLPSDWRERDLEGKWVAYRAAVAKDAKNAQSWAHALAEQLELDLLEWIALYEGWQYAGPQLRRIDAPQWLRCAVWNIGGFDSHSKDAARKRLVADGPRTLGWFEAFPTAITGLAKQLHEQLVGDGVVAAFDARDLPPFDPVQVIAPYLDVPKDIQEFGVRLKAEPRVRYVHQVQRALRAVLVHGDRSGLIISKVVRLARHDNVEISKAAFDTLTKLPAGMVPFGAMKKLMAGEQASARLRRSAVVTLSFSSHPQAMDLLVEMALDQTHFAHDVAVEQLKQRADPVALEPLRQANVGTAEHERVIDQVVYASNEHHQQGQFLQWSELHRLMLRVVWLRATGSDRAAAVAKATEQLLDESPSDYKAPLQALLDAPPLPLPFEGKLQKQLEKAWRDYANGLLEK